MSAEFRTLKPFNGETIPGLTKDESMIAIVGNEVIRVAIAADRRLDLMRIMKTESESEILGINTERSTNVNSPEPLSRVAGLSNVVAMLDKIIVNEDSNINAFRETVEQQTDIAA